MNPKYPIYIVSKGRAESRLTSKALETMNVPYYIAIEPQDYKNYSKYINKKKILVLPFSNHGEGPTPARNWCWEHAIKSGAKKHWVMDDNIDAFHYLNRNMKLEVDTGVIFKAAEDFIERYENVPLAGFNYYSFCKTTDKVPPFTINTRIYSCLLIENNIPYRWEGKYNEDTDLSLRILKDGLCTLQFNAFLQGKVTTQRMKGGNTDEFYAKEGTLKKSQYLVDRHPDVAKVVWKFNRWHHYVDYKPFKKNKLIRKENISKYDKINNYGLKLIYE